MPYELPLVDRDALDAAMRASPHKFGVVQEDCYDRMLDVFSQLGPKKFKHKLTDVKGVKHTVRFSKDVQFYYKEGGYTVVLSYNSNRLTEVLGHDVPTREEQAAMREANYTGNHRPRNHPVRVPTEPGQPVHG